MFQLIAAVVAGLSSIIGSIVFFIGRKAATALGSIAMFIIITSGFILCINALVQHALSLFSIPAWISVAIGMFIPINFAACLSVVVSSYICRAAYDIAKFKILAINSAN